MIILKFHIANYKICPQFLKGFAGGDETVARATASLATAKPPAPVSGGFVMRQPPLFSEVADRYINFNGTLEGQFLQGKGENCD